MTQFAAEYWVGLAVSLSGRLPGTFSALRSGSIDLSRAKLIDQYTIPLDDDLAQAVERKVLPGPPGRPPPNWPHRSAAPSCRSTRQQPSGDGRKPSATPGWSYPATMRAPPPSTAACCPPRRRQPPGPASARWPIPCRAAVPAAASTCSGHRCSSACCSVPSRNRQIARVPATRVRRAHQPTTVTMRARAETQATTAAQVMGPTLATLTTATVAETVARSRRAWPQTATQMTRPLPAPTFLASARTAPISCRQPVSCRQLGSCRQPVSCRRPEIQGWMAWPGTGRTSPVRARSRDSPAGQRDPRRTAGAQRAVAHLGWAVRPAGAADPDRRDHRRDGPGAGPRGRRRSEVRVANLGHGLGGPVAHSHPHPVARPWARVTPGSGSPRSAGPRASAGFRGAGPDHGHRSGDDPGCPPPVASTESAARGPGTALQAALTNAVASARKAVLSLGNRGPANPGTACRHEVAAGGYRFRGGCAPWWRHGTSTAAIPSAGGPRHSAISTIRCRTTRAVSPAGAISPAAAGDTTG